MSHPASFAPALDARTTARVPLTVVIPTLNESARIADAVADLSWADEVIVIDGGSTDDTPCLAERAGARVLTVTGQTIAAQRNAGIAEARHHWVLAVDADERVSPALRAEIARVVADPHAPCAAYRMKFQNYYLGRELRHGPWGRDWHVRLFPRDRRWVTHRVHEHLDIRGDIGSLAGTIIHHPYRDITHHVTKIVKYARWGADDLHARGRTASLWAMSARPAWRFARDYFFYSGWRDGAVGFVVSALSAFAAFLKYAFLFAKNRSSES